MDSLARRRARGAFAALLFLGVAAVVLSFPPPPPLLAVSSAALGLALFVGLGLWFGHAHGLGAPLLGRWGEGRTFRRWLAAALTFGPLTGAALGAVSLWWMRQPFVPGATVIQARVQAESMLAPWKRWLLAFDAAVLEEIGFRLFLVSAVAWLLARRGSPAGGWAPHRRVGAAIGVGAAAFGAAHLSKWLTLAPDDPWLAASIFLLNGFAGVVFGIVFRRWGIEAAILSHFTASAVIRLLGPIVVGV